MISLLVHGTAPWFREAVLHDEGLAQQFRLLFDLLEQPNNTLLKQTLFLSTIAWLVSKYSQVKPLMKVWRNRSQSCQTTYSKY